MQVVKSLVILLAVTFCSFQAICQEVFLGATKDKVTSYYIMSIKRNSNGAVDVFERVKPADGQLQVFRQQVIALRKREKMDIDGFEKLGYYRRRIQYSCGGKLFRLRECTYYDIYGKEISSVDPEQSEAVRWEPVPPSTMRELEFNKACR